MNQTPVSPTGRIAKSTAGMLIFRLGGQALTFAALILLTRHFGPEQFGIYATLTTVLSFFAVLLAPGLNDLMVREATTASLTGGGQSAKHQALRNGYGFRLLLALAAIALAVLIAPFLGMEGIDTGLTAIAALSLLTSLWSPSCRYAYDVPLQLDVKMDLSAGLNFAGRVLLVGALFAGAVAGLQLKGMVAVQIAGEMAAMLLLLLMLSQNHYPVKPAIEWTEIKRLFVLASPLILAELLTISYMRFDLLILNQIAGAEEAGLFAGPMRIIDGMLIVPSVALATLVPLFNRLKVRDEKAFERAASLAIRAMWAIGLILAITIAPFAKDLTLFLFGENYADSASILALGVFSAPLAFAGLFLPALLIVTGKQRVIVPIYMALAIINLVANLLLIPQLGGEGAIVAKIITYGAIFPLAALSIHSRLFGWNLNLAGFIPFLAAGLLAQGVTLLHFPALWGLPLIGVAAIGVIWFSGWFGRKKFEELKNILRGSMVEYR